MTSRTHSLRLMYAICTLLLVAREDSRVHNLLYFSTSETFHDVSALEVNFRPKISHRID